MIFKCKEKNDNFSKLSEQVASRQKVDFLYIRTLTNEE